MSDKRIALVFLIVAGAAFLAWQWRQPDQNVFLREFTNTGVLKARVTVQFPRPWASENEIHTALVLAQRRQSGEIAGGTVEVGNKRRVFKDLPGSEAIVTMRFHDKFPTEDALAAALQHALNKNTKIAEQNRHVPDGWDTFASIVPWVGGLVLLLILGGIIGSFAFDFLSTGQSRDA